MDDGGRGGTGGSEDSGGAGVGGSSAGAGDGGAGVGGGGVDDEAPTVETFTPDDGSHDVERDIEVTAELSEPIDEATVTETSVTLTGPDGAVTGILSVDENVISFVPDRPLYILGGYTFTLADTIADLAGNTLEASASTEFQVREGRWSEPTYPFGQMGPRVFPQFDRNLLGDVIVGTETYPGYENSVAGLYNAAENRWTIAEFPDPQGRFSGVGIDSMRRVALSWSMWPNGFGWSSFGEATGFSPIGALPGAAGITVTPGGQALAIGWDEMASRYVTRVHSLAGGSTGPIEQTPLGPGTNYGFITSGERFAIVSLRPVMDGDEIAVMWKESTGWGPLEPLAFAPDIATYSCDSDEEGNIILVWIDDVGNVKSRVYEPAQNAWTMPAPLMTVVPPAMVGGLDMTAGNAIVSIQKFAPDSAVWAAIYEAGVGWDEESIVLLGEPLIGSVAVSLDPRRNAVAIFHDDLMARRYVSGSGWSEAEPLDHRVYLFNRFAAGAPDGSVIVANMSVDEKDQIEVPLFVRFE
jgi:hypothetical protein